MKRITSSAIEILNQLRTVVLNLASEDYNRPSEIMGGTTIGQHVRHTLEFFICLMEANSGSYVNYDCRKRDHDIETDLNFADSVFGTVNDFLKSVDDNKELTLGVNYSINDPDELRVKTNLIREIAYNIEHMVHHMALIKIAVKEVAPYVTIPSTFGIASSTIKYQNQVINKSN